MDTSSTAAPAPPVTPETDAASQAAKQIRPRPTKTLPTPRISFNNHFDIIRAFATVSGPARKAVQPADVEPVIDMKASTISLYTPFATECGLLMKTEKGFVPTEVTFKFQQAYQWSPETAPTKLAPAMQETWFGKVLLPRLQFRELSEAEALSVLADESAASVEYRPQLRMLLDYLAATGLIVRDGGQIRSGGNISQERPIAAQQEPSEPMPAPKAPVSSITTAFTTSPTEGTIQFHVSVKVDMNEFSGWAPDRIAAFFSGIAKVLAAKGGVEKEYTS